MTKSIHDRGVLKPVDLAKLQRVFDEACRNCEAEPDSDDAKEIALRLLTLHDAGLVEGSRRKYWWRQPVSDRLKLEHHLQTRVEPWLGQAPIGIGRRTWALCLRLIVGTGNGGELHAGTISAISIILQSGMVEIGASLFDRLDGIDLGRLRRACSVLPGSTPQLMAARL